MILILIFATLGKPAEPVGFYNAIYQIKWPLVVGLLVLLGFIVICWFDREERSAWVETTWDFTKQILPLLFAGVLVAGLLMGRPGSEAGLIPVRYIETLVGGNSPVSYTHLDVYKRQGSAYRRAPSAIGQT